MNDGEQNPFQPPKSEFQPPDPSTDPSVFEEPWLKPDHVVPMDDRPLDPEAIPLNADPEHSVWDEPAQTPELSGELPPEATTWFRWYQSQAERFTSTMSWQITLAIGLVSGLIASLTLVMLQPDFRSRIGLTLLFLPITQELMKIVIAIWVCEKRPWLFQTPIQILTSGLISALLVATATNLVVLSLFPRAPLWIVLWRMVGCTSLHVACTMIASIGLIRVWQGVRSRQAMPRLADGARWITAAMVIHGLYNFAITLLGEIRLQL